MWGSYRNQINNMVEGVSKGFTVKLEIQGVGFRASADKNFLSMALGFSHEIKFAIPAGHRNRVRQADRNSSSAVSTRNW